MAVLGVAILVAAAFLAGLALAALVHDEGTGRVIAHRGASGGRIEHTFDAYDHALDVGVKMIEQDVVASRDGTLFVSHDANADRLTGTDRLYSDMTDEEIAVLKTANGENIHTLESVLERYRDRASYVIEIKRESFDPATLVDLVVRCDVEDRVIIQSVSLDDLVEIHSLLPKSKTMFLSLSEQDFAAALGNPAVSIVAVERTVDLAKAVEQAHASGKEFAVWVLNEPAEIQAAIEMGVDYYFTDFPELALEIEERMG